MIFKALFSRFHALERLSLIGAFFLSIPLVKMWILTRSASANSMIEKAVQFIDGSNQSKTTLKWIKQTVISRLGNPILFLFRMAKIQQFQTLEDKILILRQEAKGGALSIAEILRILSGKGRPLILILLSLPFCQPIQIPGLSMLFGLVITFIGLRIVLGKRIWLPRKLLEKKISKLTFENITDKTLVAVKKIKPWIHPRLIWLCRSPFMEKSNGLIICILGIFLSLPLPIPLTNLTAAWAIFLIALGILEDDGLLVVTGYFISLATATFFFWMGVTVKNAF